jgi:hypothetical protein
MDCVGGFGSGLGREEIVRLDVMVDEVLFMDYLNS